MMNTHTVDTVALEDARRAAVTPMVDAQREHDEAAKTWAREADQLLSSADVDGARAVAGRGSSYVLLRDENGDPYVRLRLGYGFVHVTWGPKVHNAPDVLDVPDLVVNGKTYDGFVRPSVDVYPDGQLRVSDVLGELTAAARPKVEALARAAFATWKAEYPAYFAAWAKARVLLDRSHDAQKKADALAEALAVVEPDEARR